MDERVVVGVVLLSVVAAGAVPLAVASSRSTGPSVDVVVDGLPLDRGDVYHTATDPWIGVSTSASDPITLIEVRVDGTTRHVFEPDAETVDRNVVLDLAPGRHRIEVVAKAGTVATYRATVVRDTAPPVLNYSAPFGDDATADEPSAPPAAELTVNRGNVSVNGTLSDAAGVAYVRVEHSYDYRQVVAGGGDREGQATYLVASPGTSFTRSLALAPGANQVTVHAEDAVGNVRVHEFTIQVDDDTAPSLTVTDVDWVSPTRLHVEGRVSDRVQVQSVWLESDASTDENRDVESGERHPMVFPRPTDPDPSRRTVSLDTTVYHPPGADYVVLGANDTAGNERTWNYSLSRFLAPNVTVDDRRTGYVEGRTVAVGGRVTDGQVGNVSVETVDPDTGRTVDIRPVALGANGSFGTRLDGAAGETRVRVRVRDVSGVERVSNVTVVAPAPAPATPVGSDDDAAGGDGDADDAGTDSPSGTGTPDDGSPGGIRVPIVGVVLPVPPLGASASVPLPLLGSVEVPLLGVGVPVMLAVALVVVRRR